jgi:hypothetical protein
MKNLSRNSLLGLSALLWLAVIVMLYYVNHKPFSPNLAFSLAIAIGRLLVAASLVALGGGIGYRILPYLPLHPLARLATQAAMGLGILSLGILLVASFGGLHFWLGGLSLIVLLVLFRRSVARWAQEWRALWLCWQEANRVGKFLAICLALVAFFTLSMALAPPLKFDALVYHLALPQIYISEGRLVYTPQIMFWGMPQNAEMLYTWAMILAGAEAAAVVGWMFGLLVLVGMLGYGTERLDVDSARGKDGGWVSTIVLVSGFTLASALSWGYVDWLVMLFGLSFLVTLDLWLSSAERRYLLLAGVFAGMAFGAKYSGGVLWISGAVVVMWRDRKTPQGMIVHLIQYALAVLVFASPWLVKNLLATGNMVYPFFFPAGSMTTFRQNLYQGGQPWGDWLDVLFTPLRATLLGVEGGPGYSSSIGPLFLGLALCAGLSWSSKSVVHRRAVQLAVLVALPGIIIWMVLGRFSSYLLQTRLYFVLFPGLGFLAGTGYMAIKQFILPGLNLGRIAASLIVLVVGLNTFEVGVDTLRRGAPLVTLGLRSEEGYLGDNWGWFAPVMKTVRELPSGSRVLMLWETRSLYCLPNCEPDEVLDRWLRERHDTANGELRSPQVILQGWREQGYTHLLFHRLGADFIYKQNQPIYQPDDWQTLESLLALLPTLKEFGGAYTLYEIKP